MFKNIENQEKLEQIINNKNKVIIYFTADWCNPCKKQKEHLKMIDKDENILIGIIDVEENNTIAQEKNVKCIPHMLFYKNGELIKEKQGITPTTNIKEIY